LAVCPSQDYREHPEGHDERYHKERFSSRHDLLLLLLLPARILAESCSGALIGIKSSEPGHFAFGDRGFF
jgi:hypothetical protein